MPNQFLPFFLNSRKTALIGILNMMVIVGQCAPFNLGPFSNDDFDYKASSVTSVDSLNYYPVKRLSVEKNKSPTGEGNYFFTEREKSDLNTYSAFKRESLEPESFFKRIRKRDEESTDSEEATKPESGENEEPEDQSDEEATKPESGKNEEEPKAESGENEEETKPESGEKEEAAKPESDEDEESKSESVDKAPNPESEENKEAEKPEPGEIEELKPKLSESAIAPKKNQKKPASVPGDEEEDSLPPPSKESLPPKSSEKEESLPEESLSLSTSNLEESLLIPQSGQEGMPLAKNQDTSVEDFAFQKKPLPSVSSEQKGKSLISSNQNGKGQVSDTSNGMDSGPNEFLTEENWDDYSFYPRTFPSIWKGKKSRTIRPPQQMVSWNEFLVMQDKIQKNKLNLTPKPRKNKKLSSPLHKSKDDLYSYIEDAIRRSKQIEKELMDLKRTLQK